MADDAVTEEPLQFGDGGRLFGILTTPGTPPRSVSRLPAFVFLSAGSLHRVGPYRLYVRLARELARMGFSSMRVDLAGMGDSPARRGMTNQQSVAADFAEITGVLDARLGRTPFVLAGLCSGADNAIRLTLDEPRVIGLVLLDPICFPDRGLMGFKARAVVAKFTNLARYAGWLKRRVNALMRRRGSRHQADVAIDPLAIRDLPTPEQLRAAFVSLRERQGRALSIFTEYATRYYNRAGQMGRAVAVEGYQDFCTELFYLHAHHTYWLEQHRRRLIEEIKQWAAHYLRS